MPSAAPTDQGINAITNRFIEASGGNMPSPPMRDPLECCLVVFDALFQFCGFPACSEHTSDP
jgi:hypothetical protein